MQNVDYLFYLIIGLLVLFAVYTYYEKTGFQLKCIVSNVNGNQYCVRERKRMNEAADLLATTTEKCKKLVKYLEENQGDDERVQRLVERFNPEKISETLPTSSYTAFSQNKGEKMSFCLNKEKHDNENLIDEHTLMFVSIHELSHIMTISIGHKQEFWDNFKYLLVQAKAAGIHDPVDYNKDGKKYCSMKIHDNPYYNVK